ncbi:MULTISPECIES: S46 family peptidase [Flavobacteriaceae]|uniref:Dipeptidyl-peptidase n=2 Tax=Flavobacteriaceae TaxID=49546 RepID=A0A4Y8ASF0_9FLAO|nr:MULTISPECIES: S46 family peptidase [Flavobacteriaceae]TEW73144.1 S46 family peptidase [Gramella jeungdoensis]GGK46689.1 Asp/Glu-specific dipeptidyl-peptidase [Lutibacter litoralis]
MKYIKLYFLLALLIVSCKTVQETTETVIVTAPEAVDTREIQGGMWIPSLLEGVNETEMQLLGSKLTAKDIYDVNNSSLKDAIVHFNGGCTSEIISPNGLLLTNHHCGYGAIQSHSSVEHDYLKNGFWAKNYDEELSNPSMSVTFIKRIDDVTEAVFEGVTDDMDEAAKMKLINQNIIKVNKAAKKEAWQDSNIKAFYKGNQYLLFVTEEFKDLRLVGAPPSSIGKFGADTDNWMWPRHTGDFSLFRIYADANNRPAAYSKDNVPYTPKHHLPISLDGVEEGDFTLVFGFPGSTNEYLPAVAVDQIVNVLNPAKIEVRENALKIIDSYMRTDPAVKIKYASKYASTANYWKKWIGENQGLKKSNAVQKKKELESEFSKIVAEKDLAGYTTLLADFEKLYKEIESVSLARDYWIEVAYRNVELLGITFRAFQIEQAYLRGGEQGFENAKNAILRRLEGTYKNYSAEVDKPVFEKLVALYAKKSPKAYSPSNLEGVNFTDLANTIYSTSKLTTLEGAKELLSGTPEEAIKKLNKDTAYQFGKEFHTTFYNKIEPKFQQLNQQLAAVQKQYMKGLVQVFPTKRFFPDANSTLRVTYGQVSGYEPRDGVYYNTTTYLEGVMEKFVPNDYEFDVPQKLQDLYDAKDFGDYSENGKMPVNFIGTNHTTGGNSGSPAIDAHGNLIGLNFDRVWEGTMSDYNYDADICRNIMVDIRYVLFIVDKYAGAKNLIEEMTLVHPKKK